MPPTGEPEIVIVVAIGSGRVIGVNNGLPWRIPEDLRRFKGITSGHPVVMGRRTYGSLGRPLPNRTNIVVTRQTDLRVPEGVIVARSLEEAIDLASLRDNAIFVIGGAEIYDQALDRATRIEATLVYARAAGDTFFPPLRGTWHIARREDSLSAQSTLDGEPLRLSFVTLARGPAQNGLESSTGFGRGPASSKEWDDGLQALSTELGLIARERSTG